jgi:hypothetical protein
MVRFRRRYAIYFEIRKKNTMCLYIHNNFKEQKKKFLKKTATNKDGFIKGWKIFEYDGDLLKTPYQNRLVSRLNGFVASDRFSKTLTYQEIDDLEIRNGCHFFLTENAARKIIRKRIFSKWVQRTIYYKPQDLIAIGDFHGKMDCGVVMNYYLPKA